MEVTLLNITPGAEKQIEDATRMCYNSQDKKTQMSHVKLIQGCLKRGHRSILRHAMATFEVNGISRACSHQFVRHAHLSYLQKSQRYTEVEENEFVCPIENAEAVAAIKAGYAAYKKLLEVGCKKEDARLVLPQAYTTSLIVSGNFHAWFDFLRLRLSPKAQWEIRAVAKKIYAGLNYKCPSIFNKEMLLYQPGLELEFD